MSLSSPWADDPGKAWWERFVLIYSPCWIAVMGTVMTTGVYKSFGDLGFLLFGLGLMAPLLIVPMLAPGEPDRDKPLLQRHFMRANLWLWIVVFVGNYFVTHYFFQVAGMRYGFPTQVHFEAAIAGPGHATVPFFLFCVTQAYFATYYVVMSVLLRWLCRQTKQDWVYWPGLLVMAYCTAFAETYFMAVDILADVFLYADRSRMLMVGSIFYGCFFLVSQPLYFVIDERPEGRKTHPLGAILVSGLGASMLVMLALDMWAQIFGYGHVGTASM